MKEIRIVEYDTHLKLEAYHFQGIMQKFPNHFHDHYVIGFIEGGRRFLSCKNLEYTIVPGDLVLFNPRDNHTCEQIDLSPFEYRCINIQPEIMRKAAFDITGVEYLPYFTTQVILGSELVFILKDLHQMIMEGKEDFKKEEIFYFLIEQLIVEYSKQSTTDNLQSQSQSAQTTAICNYIDTHYMDNITLEDLCKITGLSKFYLLRSFTKQKGISPYSYLETIRIENAKKKLQQGIPPIDVALQTGFTDQSHFTNFFKKFIGLTPKQYMNIYKDIF